jgi:hypothetical protein
VSTLLTHRRRLRRLGWQAAVLAVAVSLALVLAQHTAGAAFVARTADGGDRVSSAASFCAGTGTTLTPSADTSTYQTNPTTNYGAATIIGTISASGANARAFLRFDLPALPPYCTLTGATLKLYASTVSSPGRFVDVYRADPTAPLWTEGGLTDSTPPPAPVGTAATAAAVSATGMQQWTVTSLVSALYAGQNNGFVLRDRSENAGLSSPTYFTSREGGATAPQLVLTWG